MMEKESGHPKFLPMGRPDLLQPSRIHPFTLAPSSDYRTSVLPAQLYPLPDALSKMVLFDASPDDSIAIAHDASLLEVFPFYLEGDLTGWEKSA